MNPKFITLLLLSLAPVTLRASDPAEPNDTTPEPTFEVSARIIPWTVSATVGGRSIAYDNPGTIRPRYQADIIVPHGKMVNSREYYVERIKSSPLAQRLSQAQKDFLSKSFGVWIVPHAAKVPNHSVLQLYAASEEDAKTMARALLDGLALETGERFARGKQLLEEWKQQRDQRQVELAEKEKRRTEIDSQYSRNKEAIHPSLSDDEAAQLARDLIFQMDKDSNTLDIELAGIRAKVETINQYLSRTDLDNDVVEKLETLRIDQMIERNSLEARRKAIGRIYTAEQEFCSLYRQRRELEQTVAALRKALEDDEPRIDRLTTELTEPSERLVPPRVFENKVTLYRIETKDSQN
jgi:hypothetical protein